jgi:hypothetical protein
MVERVGVEVCVDGGSHPFDGPELGGVDGFQHAFFVWKAKIGRPSICAMVDKVVVYALTHVYILNIPPAFHHHK